MQLFFANYALFFPFRIDKLIRTRGNVRLLLRNFVKDEQTMVEKIHNANAVDSVLHDPVSFPSIILGTGLRFPKMASIDIRTAKYFHDRFIR